MATGSGGAGAGGSGFDPLHADVTNAVIITLEARILIGYPAPDAVGLTPDPAVNLALSLSALSTAIIRLPRRAVTKGRLEASCHTYARRSR
jgi:hypothetical protein